MAATPILAQDTTVTIGGTAIAGVKSITGIGSGSATEIDVTTLASTAKEFQMGLQDFGSVEIEMIRNQDDTGQVALFTNMAAQTSASFVVTLPTSIANVITFTGFVMSVSLDIGADSVVTGKATIRISGAPSCA
jgi:Lambda phage tail tube protein, TTP